MPTSFGQKVFDTSGSIYGVTATPSYYSSGLSGAQDGSTPGSKTVGAALTVNPQPGTQTPVNAISLFPALSGTVFGQPVTWWLLVAGAAILIYWALHHVGKIEEEVATPRIGIGSFFSIGVQATLFSFLMKALLTKYHIPGLSEFFASA